MSDCENMPKLHPNQVAPTLGIRQHSKVEHFNKNLKDYGKQGIVIYPPHAEKVKVRYNDGTLGHPSHVSNFRLLEEKEEEMPFQLAWFLHERDSVQIEEDSTFTWDDFIDFKNSPAGQKKLVKTGWAGDQTPLTDEDLCESSKNCYYRRDVFERLKRLPSVIKQLTRGMSSDRLVDITPDQILIVYNNKRAYNILDGEDVHRNFSSVLKHLYVYKRMQNNAYAEVPVVRAAEEPVAPTPQEPAEVPLAREEIMTITVPKIKYISLIRMTQKFKTHLTLSGEIEGTIVDVCNYAIRELHLEDQANKCTTLTDKANLCAEYIGFRWRVRFV